MEFKIKVNGHMIKWHITKKERFSKACPGEILTKEERPNSLGKRKHERWGHCPEYMEDRE